ncbi:MAG: trypsin-like serine protease [Alphaproteobacteria bacterium]|jgi:hypothetical protein|nr:trypsin-like serine protease [Alphaproteobacteria bacterium]
MRISKAMAALAAGLVLAGCDAVKLPGIDRDDSAEAGDSVDTPPAPAGDTQGQTSNAETDAAGEDRVDDAAEASAPVSADEADLSDPVAAEARPGSGVTQEVESLVQINAKTCGLATGEEATPTLAEVTSASLPEAGEGPQPESATFGTAAVGGIAARLTAFPGIVKMEPRNIRESGSVASGHCGATRLSERWFVTAAHCVDEGYDEIRFIAGVENIREDEDAFIAEAEMSVCHAAYSGQRADYTNDLALVRLSAEDAARLTDVPVANIATTQKTLTPFNYPTAEMAGWGLTGFSESLSPILLSAPLDVETTGPGMIVISSRNGAGPCVGDSGGPLYVTEENGKKVVVGVLSVVEQNAEGEFCKGDYRGRYTNLQGYADWMESVTRTCDNQPDLCR